MPMIPSVKPYGSVNESVCAFLLVGPTGKHYVVDKDSNQWEIDEDVFQILCSKGYVIKEVRVK